MFSFIIHRRISDTIFLLPCRVWVPPVLSRGVSRTILVKQSALCMETGATIERYLPFCIICWFQAHQNSTLEKQVTKTTLTSRSGWFWLPVFPILIISKLEASRQCKIGEFLKIRPCTLHFIYDRYETTMLCTLCRVLYEHPGPSLRTGN